MRCVGKERLNDKVVLITETDRFLRNPKTRKFYASKCLVSSYWTWLELPHKTIVPDALSFQLDSWLGEFEDLEKHGHKNKG